MVSRVNSINKKTGVTYVYESKSYWDKEKKQARNKRVCVGKLDPVSKEFIPSKRLMPAQAAARDPAVMASAQIVGPAMILDKITQNLGIDKLLKTCFPETYQQIITMAYYLVGQGGPLSHCNTWCKSHAPHIHQSLTSQRISEILNAISTDAKQTFLHKWMHKISQDDYLCYDITSVSSYSELNEYIKYGYNRDKEKLPQLNLAMVFSQHGRLPVYFQRTPGSITDVTTLHNQLKTFKALGIKDASYVMDKGFYSKKNVDDLLARRDKFLLAVPLSNKWLQKAIDDIREDIHGPEGYVKLDDEILYINTRLYPWGNKNCRCYLHLYYNAKAKDEAVDKFNEHLVMYKKELESGKTNAKHQWAYEAFFLIKKTPKRGLQVSYNKESVSRYIKNHAGFQALLSNSIKDPIKALQVYRDKDVVEKSFDDLKNQLDMKRLRMHSSKTTDGRLFIQFIALIYMSALRKEMRQTGLLEQYTSRELLQEMSTLTKIKYTGKYGHILTELTKSQKQILKAMNINLPEKS